MYAVELSAGALFGLGVIAGVVLSVITLVVVALIFSKKQ